jgi:8-oxo-dGTP pyrophosphatase MutT (NUDIX family)
MLHLHKKHGRYMQFGGHIELNENPWQAITHELKEESGYEIDQVQLLQPRQRLHKISHATIHPQPVSHTTHPVPGDHFHTDIVYALTTREEPRSKPDEGESTHIKLFTRAELLALPTDQIFENVREIALYIFDEVLPSWEAVPTDTYK